MDTAFNENKTELGVLVLSVLLQMLSNSDSLLHQMVKILRDLRGKTIGLQDTKNFAASNVLDLTNSVRVSKLDTDLRRSKTLSCQFGDLITNFVVGGFQPGWGTTTVGDS